LKEVKATRAKKKDDQEAREKGLDQYEVKDEDIVDYQEFLKDQKEKTEQEMKGEQKWVYKLY